MTFRTRITRWVARVAATLALLPLASGCAASDSDPCAGGVLAVRGGRLFDGTGGPVLESAAVLVRGGRIAAAGPSSEIEVPACAEVVDATGGTILPGVIDNHVHLYRPLRRGEDVLTPWLRAGVTTLVDVGSPDAGEIRRLAAGLSDAAPRLYLSGPIFTAPWGYPMPGQPSGDGSLALGVDGPESASREARRIFEEARPDLLKVAVDTGFFSDYDDAGWPVPAPATLAALARAAHGRGKTIRAHVTQPGELAAVLDAGFDGIAHAPIASVPGDLLRRAAEAGMVFTTTAAIWGEDDLTATVQENLVRYLEAGGRIALGTDAPTFQPGSGMPLKEMRVLVAGGLTPQQVLLAATRDGAAALGLEADLGTLERGKLADLLVVEGDPLADVEAMGKVRVVVRDGHLVVPAETGAEPTGGRAP